MAAPTTRTARPGDAPRGRTAVCDVRALPQLAVVIGVFLAYSWIRTLTAEDLERATANALALQDLQQRFGLDIEAPLQELAMRTHHLVVAANWYYLVHFPVTIAVGVVTFRMSRATFLRLRDAAIITTALGLLLHLAVPLAPPRMFAGFIDTGRSIGPDPYALPDSSGANQLAAMPSLHVAWAVLAAVAVWQLTSRLLPRVVAAVHPVLTAAVVLVSANHYVSDVAVGAVFAALGWWFVVRVRRPDPGCRGAVG